MWHPSGAAAVTSGAAAPWSGGREWAGEGAEGNVVPATYYGLSPDWPLESLTTVTFEELAGATRVAVRDEGAPLARTWRSSWRSRAPPLTG